MDECEYLLAIDVCELEELTLGIKIVEAKPQEQIVSAADKTILGQLLVGGRHIRKDATCRSFSLHFRRNHMVSYTVLNESYGKYPEASEMFTGKRFRTFSHSHLLDYTRRQTIASDAYPGKLMHFQIACENHIFDVICTAPPKISVADPKV